MALSWPAPRRAIDLAAVLLFAGALAAPSVDELVRPDRARDSRLENRQPAPNPGTPDSFEEVLAWPNAWDRHFRDTFGLRDVLLSARNTNLLRLHLAPGPLIDVTSDGWIAYRGDAAFQAHRGTWQLDPRVVDAWCRSLQERKNRLALRGARFLFVVAPDKETIYPEHLPDTWAPVGSPYFDRLLAELRRRTDVEILDLRPALLAEKRNDRPELDDFVYMPRGTHWSGRGAFVAAAEIQRAIQRDFPAARPLVRGNFVERITRPEHEDSWAHVLYAQDLLRTGRILIPGQSWMVDPGPPPMQGTPGIVVRQDEPRLPKVLLLHDSFGPYVYGYLAQRASELRCLWQSWVPEPLVESTRPDVVVLMRVERMLTTPPQEDVRSSDPLADAQLAATAPAWALGPDAPVRVPAGGGAVVEPAPDGAGILLRVRSTADVIEIGSSASCPQGFVPALRVAGTAPDAGSVMVVPNVVGDATFPRRRAIHVRLPAGRFDQRVVLPVPEFGGRALLRFQPRGSWRLDAIELRYVDTRAQPADVRTPPDEAREPRDGGR